MLKYTVRMVNVKQLKYCRRIARRLIHSRKQVELVPEFNNSSIKVMKNGKILGYVWDEQTGDVHDAFLKHNVSAFIESMDKSTEYLFGQLELFLTQKDGKNDK